MVKKDVKYMNLRLLSMFVVLLLLGSNAIANEGKPTVTFNNNSDNLLKCEVKTDNEYTPFIRLQPGASKRFENFKLGSQVRCQTIIDDHSSTVLTYFNVNTEGIYELLKERVHCETCPSKLRWATIVTFPNGEAYYTKWKI